MGKRKAAEAGADAGPAAGAAAAASPSPGRRRASTRPPAEPAAGEEAGAAAAPTKKPARGRPKKAAAAPADEAEPSGAVAAAAANEAGTGGAGPFAPAAAAAAAAKAPSASVSIPRCPTPRAPPPPPGTFRHRFKALTFNVAGLRAVLKNNAGVLTKLLEVERPDALLLQEHKLQEKDVALAVEQLATAAPGYTAHFSCSTAKLGYSGTAVLLRADGPLAPLAVTPGLVGMEAAAHAGEGRLMTAEYESFFLVVAYVPNSGQELKRLDYRVEQWDRDLAAALAALQARKPVLLGGDMNVGVEDVDIHNPTAKHIHKQAGLTPAERASFRRLLSDAGLVDTFRARHGPAAAGCFTYWSQRAGNRPTNRGIRLDYFLATAATAGGQAAAGAAGGAEGGAAPASAPGSAVRLHDAYIVDDLTVGVSDHCPAAVELLIA